MKLTPTTSSNKKPVTTTTVTLLNYQLCDRPSPKNLSIAEKLMRMFVLMRNITKTEKKNLYNRLFSIRLRRGWNYRQLVMKIVLILGISQLFTMGILARRRLWKGKLIIWKSIMGGSEEILQGCLIWIRESMEIGKIKEVCPWFLMVWGGINMIASNMRILTSRWKKRRKKLLKRRRSKSRKKLRKVSLFLNQSQPKHKRSQFKKNQKLLNQKKSR